MAENILPVQIVIVPPDAGQITRAMSDIQAKVAASGRTIGQSAVGKLDDSHVKQYHKSVLAQQKLFAREWMQFNTAQDRAQIEDRRRALVEKLGMEKLHTQAIIENRKREAAAERAMEKLHSQAIIEDRRRALVAEVAIERAKQKELLAAQRAASPEAIHTQAGLTSPQERIRNINAVKQAQSLATAELAKGTITLSQYNLLMSDANKRLNLFEYGNVRARGAVHQFIAKMASLTFEVTGAIYGFGVLIATLASPMLLGVNFLRKLEDTKMGMTGILLSMGAVNGRMLTFAEASQAANEQVTALARESINLAGTLEEFSRSYQAILAPGLAAGMNLTEIRKIAIAGTVAVKTIGLDSRQIVQEIRDLVAGGIQAASSTLATSLGLTDKDIKAAKLSSEGLFKFLSDKLEGFVKAAERRPETLSGKIEQTWEIFTQALASQSEYAFTAMKEMFDLVLSKIGVFEKLADGTKKFIGFNPEFISGIRKTIDALTALFKFLVAVVDKLWEFKDVILGLAAARVGVRLFESLISGAVAYKNALIGILATQKAVAVGSLLPSAGLATGAANIAKTIIGIVGKLGVIGIILYGVQTAWGWWKEHLDAAAKDIKDSAKEVSDAVSEGVSKANTSWMNREQARVNALSGQLLEAQKDLASEQGDRNKISDIFGITSYEARITKAQAKVNALAEAIVAANTMINTMSAMDKAEGKGQFTTKPDAGKPIENISDQITRMNGAINDAKRALSDMGLEFEKGYEAADKNANALLAFQLASEELAKTKARKNEIPTKELEDYNNKLAYQTSIVSRLGEGLKYQTEIDQARLRVKTASAGMEKEIAERDLRRLEEKIPLLGALKAYEEDLAIAIAKDTEQSTELTRANLAGLQVKIALTKANLDLAASYDPLKDKAREAAKEISKTGLTGRARGLALVDADIPNKGLTPAGKARAGLEKVSAERDKAISEQDAFFTKRISDLDNALLNEGMSEKDHMAEMLRAHKEYAQAREQIEANSAAKRQVIHQTQFQEELDMAAQYLQVASSLINSISQVYEAKARRQVEKINSRYEGLAETIENQVKSETLTREEADARLTSLEKQRQKEADSVAKRAFERGQKLQRAMTILNTAAAIMGIAASTSVMGPLVWAQMAAMAAAGAAQLAVINNTSFQGGGGGSSALGAPGQSSTTPGQGGGERSTAQPIQFVLNVHGSVLGSDLTEIVSNALKDGMDKEYIRLDVIGNTITAT